MPFPDDLTQNNEIRTDPPVTCPVEIAIGLGLIEKAESFIMPAVEKAAVDRSAHWGFDIKPLRVYDDPDLDDYDYRIYLMGKLKGGSDLRTEMFMAQIKSGTLPEGCVYVRKLYSISKTLCWVPYIRSEVMADRGHILLKPEDIFINYIKRVITGNIHELYTPDHFFASLKKIGASFTCNSEETTLNDPGLHRALYLVIKKLLINKIPVTNFYRLLELVVTNIEYIDDIDVLYEQVNYRLNIS